MLVSIRKALASHKGYWPWISAQTGVSHSWLVKVHSGLTPNPRIQETQKVFNLFQQLEAGEKTLPEK